MGVMDLKDQWTLLTSYRIVLLWQWEGRFRDGLAYSNSEA